MRIRMLFFALFLGVAGIACAEPVDIVAVVDDQPISNVDLDDRINLIMGITGIPNTPENHARLAPQILRQLVDEKLQMEDATKNSITVTDEMLHEGIAKVEKQGGKPPGSLEAFIDEKGLSKQSYYNQIRAQIAWSETLLKKIRPRVHISDEEVARYIKRKEAAPKAPEVQIETILLPVDAPQNETNVKKLADKLAGEIRAGANFDAVAAQFSTSTGAGHAADAFWVELPQMDPVIAAAVTKTQKGQITDPLRTANGYQIVKLVDVRAPQPAKEAAPQPRAELAYKKVLMTLKPDAKTQEAQLLLDLAKQVARSPGKCNDKSMAGVGDLAALDFKVSLERNISTDLPEKLRDLLMKLPVGGVSEPVVTPEGVHLFMLCERIDMPPAKNEADDSIRQAIYMEKLELEAQKYMRNLRREAFIEIRSPQGQ